MQRLIACKFYKPNSNYKRSFTFTTVAGELSLRARVLPTTLNIKNKQLKNHEEQKGRSEQPNAILKGFTQRG